MTEEQAVSDAPEWTRITLDPCERCGANRWQDYPADDTGMRMICDECANVAPLEFRILEPMVGLD